MGKLKKPVAKKKELIDVEQFRGIVADRVLAHYWRVPKSAQNWFTVDDAIQDTLYFLHRVLNQLPGSVLDPRQTGRKKKLDLSKASITTWVWKIADNCCHGFDKLFFQKRYAGETICIDDVKVGLADRIEVAAIQIREAREAVSRLNSLASQGLLEFLDTNLYHNNTGRVSLRSQKFHTHRVEFQKLAKREKVSIDQYRLALSVEPRQRHA